MKKTSILALLSSTFLFSFQFFISSDLHWVTDIIFLFLFIFLSHYNEKKLYQLNLRMKAIEKKSSVLDNMSVPVVVLDLEFFIKKADQMAGIERFTKALTSLPKVKFINQVGKEFFKSIFWRDISEEGNSSEVLAFFSARERNRLIAILYEAYQKKSGATIETEILQSDGSYVYLLLCCPKINEVDKEAIFSVIDVTRRVKRERELERKNKIDSLTQCLTRDAFSEYLIQKTNMTPPGVFSLLFIDLDKFKSVNDSYGHSAGDDLLKEVYQRIRSVIRRDDVIGRLGGDEFCVCLNNNSKTLVESISRDIVFTLKRPFLINNVCIEIGCSIGISQFPVDSVNVNSLLKMADTAMYSSKFRGGSCYTFTNTFDPNSVPNFSIR